MVKVSVVVLAGTESPEAMGRVANALELAKEASQAGDEVELIFDGAGVGWPGELRREEHKLRPLYESVEEVVTGACEYCAGAFGTKAALEKAGVPLLGEFDGHPSLRRRLADGYQVVTF